MKTEFKAKPTEFKPVTVQLTFETEQELATFCALSYAGEIGPKKIEKGVDITLKGGHKYSVGVHEMLGMLEDMIKPTDFWKHVDNVD